MTAFNVGDRVRMVAAQWLIPADMEGVVVPTLRADRTEDPFWTLVAFDNGVDRLAEPGAIERVPGSFDPPF